MIESALLIVYLRHKNLSEIVDKLVNMGIKKVFFHVDFPRILTPSHLEKHQLVLHEIDSIRSTYNIECEVLIQNSNLGCSKSVLVACDWFFSKVEHGLVLEDDCIPVYGLIKFMNTNLDILKREDVWFICGRQHIDFPECRDDHNAGYLSSYPNLWGWCTNYLKWSEIKIALNDFGKNKDKTKLFDYFRSYWYYGAKRAYLGYVDVWDTIVTYSMQVGNIKAFIPYTNFIDNNGDDEFATNFKEKSKQNFLIRGRPNPYYIDKYMTHFFYKIKLRHYLTVRVTCIIDYIRSKIYK